MPELPDITAYITALDPASHRPAPPTRPHRQPLLLRTAIPRIDTIEGRTVHSLRRIGKRIVFVFPSDSRTRRVCSSSSTS